MAYIQTNKLPSYFYTNMHPLRQWDPYVYKNWMDGEERQVLLPHEIISKGRRNDAYRAWLKKFDLAGRNIKFQWIQILRRHHSENNVKDWWGKYQDCLFLVFVQPVTVYDGKVHKQWYVLSPEDCYLVNRYELEANGPTLPPRDPIAERWISTDKRLRRCRLVPVECCRHWRHETTAGRLPEGL